MLVDIHAHLHIKPLIDNLDQVIQNAIDVGVTHIICTGTDTESNKHVLEIAKKYEIVHAACGLYPDQADKETTEAILWIEKHQDEIIAISECGLDYHHYDNKDEQKDLFIKQIKLANQLNKPLIIHSRKAESDTLDILEQHAQTRVILHAFEGNKKLMQRAIDLGFFLTITSNITRSDQVQHKAKLTPISQLLTETDCPYMGPIKDQPNEPATVKEAIKKLAEIKLLDETECKQMIFMNYKKIFG